jgi:hypothetical protein
MFQRLHTILEDQMVRQPAAKQARGAALALRAIHPLK